MWQYIVLRFLSQVLLPPNARHHFTKRTCPPPLKNKGEKKRMCETSMFRPKDGSESVLVLCRAAFGSSRGYLRGSLGPRDRPKRVSRFVLELCSASCARFLLPKMAWGASMLCFISPRSLLESILSFHTDPPTLENDDFTKEIPIYSKKSKFSNTFIRSRSPTSVSFPLSPRTWEIFLP